ncbi:hypothetical protein V12B01_13070 [Vibrio splendidus 12B01]|nr:hypothetical protein V12B01_13070 [Vibrio splendidus 12B01]
MGYILIRKRLTYGCKPLFCIIKHFRQINF